MKTALVLGAGGFIGSHLVKRLKAEGYWVRGVDIKQPEFSKSEADQFLLYDLRNTGNVNAVFRIDTNGYVPNDEFNYLPPAFNKTIPFDEVYQLAADMGGAGYLFTGENDANIMANSALINLNVLNAAVEFGVKKIFYSSSACVYPKRNQEDPNNPKCGESTTYPAEPDSEYGWEKLFSERLYMAFAKDYGLDVRIARFHGIFGPEGTWDGGKEKAPAAICRKVAEASDEDVIDVWGNGDQTRSFLFIDECVEAVRRFMEQTSFQGPVNIGSEKMITINDLAKKVIALSGKNIGIRNVAGPVGVRGRNSDNSLYLEKMGWSVPDNFEEGLKITYEWINEMVKKKQNQ